MLITTSLQTCRGGVLPPFFHPFVAPVLGRYTSIALHPERNESMVIEGTDRKLFTMTIHASLPTALPAHSRHYSSSIDPRCDFIQQGDIFLRPRLVLDGWAAGYRITVDGRRQLTNLYLPGDIIGVWRSSQSGFYHAVMSINRLSLMEFATRPDREVTETECALFERQLENSIFRLGCLNAYERMAHLFLELGERLAMRGHGDENRYRMPLTQELLADLVGISSVHVNRTLQQMRADGVIRLVNGNLELKDRDDLADQVNYQPLV